MPLIEKVTSNSKIPELSTLIRPLDSKLYTDHPTAAREAVEKVNASYYFLMGQTLSKNSRSSHALAAYDQLKKIDGESSLVYFYLAQEMLKKGLISEGVAAARKSLELDPKNTEAKIFLGNLFATSKKYGDATKLFEEVLQDDPDNEDVMLYMALIETEQKQNSKAFARITKFLINNPDSALAYYYLGRLEQEQNHPDKAIQAYRKAIDIRPGFVQAGTFLGYLLEEKGERKAAIETYSWLASQTDDPTYHKKLGHLLLDDKQLTGALRAFENFERHDAEDLNNKVKIALIHVENKNFDLATQKFEEVLKKAPESENVRYYLAAVWEQREDLKKAFGHYDKIQATAELYPEAFRRKVFVLAKSKEFEKGWNLIQAALKNVPIEKMTEEELFETGARFLEEFENESDRQLKFIDDGLAKNPQSEKLMFLKGGALDRSGRRDEAIAQMSEVLKVNPASAQALNFIGYSWAEKGENLAQAEFYIRKALKIKPKDPFISDSLGWVLFKRGQFKDALQILEEAFVNRPDEAVIADHLGDVLVKLGRIEEAKKYYEIAIRLGPTREVKKEKVEEKLAKLSSQKDSQCAAPSKNSALGTSGGNDNCAERLPNAPRAPASPNSP